MNRIAQLYTTAGAHPIKSAIIITLLAAAGLYLLNQPTAEEGPSEAASLPAVTLTTAQAFQGGDSLSLLGNVRAFSEAAITTERAGRVVRVNVSLGQRVGAGQVLATLENAAEAAAVLQAEGAYDAAVAASAQSGVGVAEANTALVNANNSAVATFKSTFNTVNGIIYSQVDSFFASPQATVPGLRIDGKGYTNTLNTERVAYQAILPAWQARVNSISAQSDLTAELGYASTQVQRTLALVDTFLRVFEQQTNSGRYTEAELQSFNTTFSSLRSQLIGSQTAIDSALTAITAARDSIARAELAASGGTTSAADAQIKQALGSLRAAQANYAKTVLRTPISGTINTLNIRQGDFVNSFVEAAKVANNNALEIVTYVGDAEQALLQVGDAVVIENEYPGTVVQIAPAVDPTTGKTEVRIATENTNIKNGDTVTITKEVSAESVTDVVSIPLTAVKFELTDGFVFVVADGVLVQQPVTLGVVRGGAVEITAGLSAVDQFVVDARGLLPGTAVTITQ